ncbi:DUF362 domain-containing protein, partial [Myxococcota bacterium]
MKRKKNKISRRKFIKLVGGGAACLGAASCIPHVGGDWDSCEVEDPGEIPTPVSHRVVEVKAEGSVVETEGGDEIVAGVAVQMFSAGLLALTDAATLEEAWQMVLPGRLDGERIALKVNALNPDVPTSPEVCAAIVDSLRADLQVEAEDIFIWDRTTRELERAKLERLGVAIRGTTHSATDESGPGYEPEPACLSGRKIFLSRVLTREVDHLINVAVMKNHFAAKFTGCMKNNYGSFSEPYKFHEGSDDHVANLNVMPEITRVSRLFVIDALFGVCVGDTDKPADCAPRRILFSFDPVAIDQRGLEIRDEMRLSDYGEGPGPRPGYIEKAAALGLGKMEYELVS